MWDAAAFRPAMKLDARQFPALLRDPSRCRLALIYGDDEGQIRERSQLLTRQVAGSVNDPFLVVELSRGNWGQIPSEMAALSMLGGRRVIIVRDASDAVLGPASQALKGPGGALLILEAPELGRGKLRSFAEAAPDAIALACYPDEGRALSDLVTSGLADMKVTIDQDALAWLSRSLSGDRAILRSEIEKLALLAGPGGQINLEAARACAGENAAGSADEGVLAAMGGRIEAADTGVEAAVQDGLAGVAIVRIALSLLQRLHQARLRMDDGETAADAVRFMRPPVFFRAQTATAACLALWSTQQLLRALEEARQTELACKRTGSRQELLARRLVAGLARQAAARRQATHF